MKIIFISFFLFSVANAETNLKSKVYQLVKQDLLKIKKFNKKQLKAVNILTVGTDSFCDTNTIQNAINANPDEIRITTQQDYYENLVLINNHVTIRGGFANCLEADNNNQTLTKTKIISTTNDSTISIGGSNSMITLDNLELTSTSYAFAGVALTYANGGPSGSLLLQNSLVHNNRMGLYLISDSNGFDVVVQDSTISNNYNTQGNGKGGGIFCYNDDNVSIFNSNILNNSANNVSNAGGGEGGGIYMAIRCKVNIYSGSIISGNYARNKGGGIRMADNSELNIIGQKVCVNSNNCLGNNANAVMITNNHVPSPTMDGGGGAIYLSGNITNEIPKANVYGGTVMYNNSAKFGGAIYLMNNAEFNMERTNRDCWDLVLCNEISSNKSSSNNGIGGAIYNNNSKVRIYNTYFDSNQADTGTVIYSVGSNASNRLISNTFFNNGNAGVSNFTNKFVFRAYNGAKFSVYYSTFADNHADTLFGIRGTGSLLSLNSSIVHDPTSGNILNLDGGTSLINCVMAHEVTTISGNLLSLNNPHFVNRVTGDLHLKPNSPAIDYCNDLLVSEYARDMDFSERGLDDPETIDNFANSFFDIGADEKKSDIIFSNGFEIIE